MSEYYGVTTPTEDFIAHWGVKGMKWGIRKAKPVGSGQPHSFGYRRAERKLAKLEAKANRNALLAKANRLDKVSKGARKVGRVGLGAAAVGTGGNALVEHIAMPNRIKRVNQQHQAVRRWASGEVGSGVKNQHEMLNATYNRDMATLNATKNISRGIQAGGAGVAALGYGTAIGSKLRANALRRRANDASKMAAARKKAAEYRKEMNAKYGIQRKRRK